MSEPQQPAFAAPFISRLHALERELADERERRVRAERLATSLAQRIASEHQRRVAAEAVAGGEPVPAMVGGPAAEQAAPEAFARWRNLRP